jgi:photosystem II stability/assembly factor-like uncharacterized protein
MKKTVILFWFIGLTSLLNAQVCFEKIHPVNKAGTYYDVCRIANGKAIICGDDGYLAVSQDDGLTWSPVSSGTLEPLYALGFLNENTGFTGGNNGILLKTTNGGENWDSIYSFPQDVNEIHVINDTFVLVTTVRYRDDLDVIVDSSDLYYTSVDGGITWESDTIQGGYKPVSMDKVSDSTWCMACQFITKAIPNIHTKVYKTNNFGDDWQPIVSTDTMNIQMTAASFFPSNTLFINRDTGFVFTHYPFDHYLYDNSLVSMLTTNDGGETWKHVNYFLDGYGYPNNDLIRVKDAIAVSDTSWYIAGNRMRGGAVALGSAANKATAEWPSYFLHAIGKISSQVLVAVGDHGLIFRSADNGANWALVDSMPAFNLNYMKKLNDGNIMAAYTRTDEFEFIYYTDVVSVVIRSIDSGENWDVLNVVKDVKLDKLDFVTDSFAYGMRRGSSENTVYSDNAAKDWQTTDSTLNSGFYGYEVSFLNKDTGYIAQVDEMSVPSIYFTADAGQNWIKCSGQYYPLSFENSFEIEFFNKKPYMATEGMDGSKKEVFTTDNYIDWYIDSTLNLTGKKQYDFNFVNDTLGFILADDTLAHTKNGGETWDFITLGDTLQKLSFFNDSIGLIYGNNKIALTTNTGDTWTFYNLPTRNIINGLQMVSDSVILAYGENGTIIKCLLIEGSETPLTLSENISDIEKHLILYPNPVYSQCYLCNLSTESAIIEIYNLRGQQVKSLTISSINGCIELNLSSLNEGIYFLREVNTAESIKLIKK